MRPLYARRCACYDERGDKSGSTTSLFSAACERVALAEHWCEHALQGAEQCLRFAEAFRQVGDLLVLLPYLAAKKFVLSFEDRDIARRVGLCRT